MLALVACAPPATEHETEPTARVWFEESILPGNVFFHSAALDGSYSMPENLGPGVGVFDYDGDGDLDLYIVNGGDASRPTPNRLLRQEGDGRFVDVTEASGSGDEGYGMGVATGDVDRDGDTDLFLTNFGPDRLYLNNGDGSFREFSLPPAAQENLWSSSAAFCDVNADGLLDLYIVTYVDYELGRSCTDRAGRQEYCGPSVFPAVPDLLLVNTGDGSFVDASGPAGISAVASRGLGVLCHDLDGDGLADIFVANDGEKNDLWLNAGNGSFAERAVPMGAATNLLGRPEASMGVAVGDVDADFDLDILLSHLDRESNTFYRNLGSSGFEDATAQLGLGPVSLPFTGFGAVFFDPDLDGDLDLLLANGKVRRGSTPAGEEALAAAAAAGVPTPLREYAESNLLLENIDRRFVDRSTEAGSLCSRVEVGRGLVVGDLNSDGRPDVVLANCAGPTRVFLNAVEPRGHWLGIRALDTSGSHSLGAEVRLAGPNGQQLRPVISSYSYQSAGDPAAHFGLGDAQRIDNVTILWPSGARSRIIDPAAGHFIHVYEAIPKP